MKLADITATLTSVAAVAGVAAVHTYTVGAGSANADGVVGFIYDQADETDIFNISFIPGATAAAAAIGDELADIFNALGIKATAVSNGSGLVTITDDSLSERGNDISMVDVTEDTGIAVGTIAQTVTGVNPEEGEQYVAVDDGVNTVINFTILSLTANPSMVARRLRKNGFAHDLDTQKTWAMMSHAIAIRILEQL